MPPKQKFSRQEIVTAALSLTREKGISAVTARDVGAVLGTSSKPVYTVFSSMAELKGAVYAAAAELFSAFSQEAIDRTDGLQYKALGVAYIDFARRERELFKLLFMSDRTEIPNAGEVDLAFYKAVSLVRLQTGIPDEAARRLHTENWVFVHGIATMIATSSYQWTSEEIAQMTSDVYQALIARMRKGESV